VSLETVGRRSGQRRANALVRADYEGQQYLVSMLGEKSEWVRNARAREGAATIRHGQRTTIRLEEVPVDERAPILKAYLSRARGARRHFTVRHDAPVEAFNAVANEYPVFRIVPGSPTPEPPAMTAETVASR
jgi:deazaflavin-dependent oxidoreductase (nitroreductase family)